MEKRRAGFGLRLDLMYRLEKLFGNVAYLLLYDYSFSFETLKFVTFVLNVVVA